MINTPSVNIIHVGIGQVREASSPDVLKAILGSCIGIAFMVPSRNIFAMAHCLLSTTNETTDQITAKYVVHAVPSLFKILGLTKFDVPLIQAVVAGGAAMQGDPVQKILRMGEMNTKAALETLELYKVKIIHQDTGNYYGRQLILDCSNGHYQVRNLILTDKKTGS